MFKNADEVVEKFTSVEMTAGPHVRACQEMRDRGGGSCEQASMASASYHVSSYDNSKPGRRSRAATATLLVWVTMVPQVKYVSS